MNPQDGATALAAPQPMHVVLDRWAKSLGDVLHSMTDCQPKVEWRAGDGPPPADPEPPLWWEQPFRGGPQLVVWVGAPRAVWQYAGALTLKAAGLENAAETEARNTWFEILGQSLGEMALAIGSAVGHEVACESGVEREPGAQAAQWATVNVQFPGVDLPPCTIVFDPGLVTGVNAPAEPPEEEAAAPVLAAAVASPSRTMDLLLDVDLPVSISFGKTQLPLRDVLKLMTGSIVGLNRGVNDQVDVLVNHCLVARGEVVVVEGNYGVRIQEIASRRERLRSVQ